MAGHQVGGGQLHIVPRVRGRDGEHVVLHVGQQVVRLEHWQRKGMQPEESEE